jgi:hypothetical protein
MSDEQRIIQFRLRGSPQQVGPGWHRAHPAPPAESLAKYEGGTADDNYRHRMMVNLAALAFTILLGVIGGWLALEIAEMRKNQDCVLSGRRTCTPIDFKRLE